MAPARVEEYGCDTTVDEVSVTKQRYPFIPEDKGQILPIPGTARANLAASIEAPYGTQKGNWARDHAHETVLQQHCAFFDTDNDGVIWPLDTYRGFYRLGYGAFVSLLSMVIIHPNFSYPTLAGWVPDPFLRIYIARIHKGKHGSDSGTYDNEGRFIPQKFEEIFSKYATGDRQSISIYETLDYMKGQRVISDPIGWGGAAFEWIVTWILLWPEDGRIKKEDIRQIFDGSLFFEIAAKREKKKQ